MGYHYLHTIKDHIPYVFLQRKRCVMAARLSPNNHNHNHMMMQVVERMKTSIPIPPYNYHLLIKRNPRQLCSANNYTLHHFQLISMQQVIHSFSFDILFICLLKWTDSLLLQYIWLDFMTFWIYFYK